MRVVLVAMLVLCGCSKEVNLQVKGISWEYKEDLHQRTLKHDSGWGHPQSVFTVWNRREDAFNIDCHRKYYGQERCNPYKCGCHQRCHGSGPHRHCSTSCNTCYHSCSVYKKWCEYDYYAWPVVNTKSNTGTDHSPSWPGLKAADDTQRVQRYEIYRVKFADGDEERVASPTSLTVYKYFNVSDWWLVRKYPLDSRVDALRPTNFEAPPL